MENTRISQSKNNSTRASKHYQDIYERLVSVNEDLLGRGATYDSDLHDLGTEYFGQRFAGVFASDTIPLATNFRYCIVNLDSQDKPGSHWVAIAKDKGKLMVYDSFGRTVTDILPDLHGAIDVDRDAEQSDQEENCGPRALAWLMMYDLFGPKVAAGI